MPYIDLKIDARNTNRHDGIRTSGEKFQAWNGAA